MNGVILGFAIYMIGMGAIGVWSWLKTKNNNTIENFLVGEKNFGPILTAFGVGTSLASGYAFIGLVGMAYLLGSAALFQPIFTTIIELIMWMTLAKKIRRFTFDNKILTPVEMVSKLKGDPYNLIKICGGLLISLFITFYLAGQFVSGAKAAAVLGIGYNTAVWISALLVLAYVFFGGVLAVMWTDAIQGFLMVISFFLLLGTVLVQSGGFFHAIEVVASVSPKMVMWTNGRTGSILFWGTAQWFGIGLGFLGQPQAIQKLITIKDEKSIPAACMGSTAFNTIRQYVPIMIGLCGRVIFDNLSDPELLTPSIIGKFFPNLIGGIILASIFAAIMSTTDSLILQSTGEFSRNVIQLGLMPNASEKQIAWITKIMTLVVAGIGLWIAMFTTSGSFTMINFAFAGLSASMASSMFCGFLWKKCTSWGCLAGVLTGIPATMIWFYNFKASTGIHEGLFGNFAAITAVVVVSLLTQSSLTQKAK